MFARYRARIRDNIIHSPFFRSAQSLTLLLSSYFSADAATARARAVAAFQRLESSVLQSCVKRALGKSVSSVDARIVQRLRQRYSPATSGNHCLTRSIILKEPGPGGERGILMVQFEYNWCRLFADQKMMGPLVSEYDILLGTSWSPTDYRLLDLALAMIPGPIYVLPSGGPESVKLTNFHPRIQVPPVLSACDWVNPSFFSPKPQAERAIDFLMVANWAPFKRHFELFEALQRMPGDLRVVLVGQRERNHDRASIESLAAAYQIPQRIEIHESLRIEEVTRLQCDSRVCLILSRREGSCVAATEALFAGAALGMRADAHVGALQYVNEHTGALLRPRHMADDLMGLLRSSSRLRPELWARENISCHQSITKLNAFMKAASASHGRPWTEDLAPFHWRPYPTYVHEADRERLRPEYQRLHRQYPDVFSSDLVESSHR